MPVNYPRAPLLQSKRNEVFARVSAAGFAPAAFEWTTAIAQDQSCDVLTYRANREFTFTFVPGYEWFVTYSPGEHLAHDSQLVGDWSYALQRVDWWLSYLRRETEAPDLWSGLVSGTELGDVPDKFDNRPFTPDEREDIAGRIEVLRTRLLEMDRVTEEDTHVIVDRLDYLTLATERLGRFDWRGVAAAVVLEFGARGLLDTNFARTTFEYLVGAARQLLGG